MAENWNVSKGKKKGLASKIELAVLVGVITPAVSEDMVKEHLDELEFLAHTAGAKTKKRFIQKMRHPDSRTFVGKGKLEEIAEYVEAKELDMVIFDDDLTGKQTQILEEKLKVKIIDRSSLILDIFASRAQTAQAKAQVELAQLQYLLPRLRGLWTHLERQRGGIGMRGPGEMEIETDRRIVRDKITLLKKKLEKINKQNSTRRKNREAMVRVALVGYTNVGKSTLMNLLSKSDVFAENKLFATLDTTVRKVVLDRMPFLLSDTVGFIRKLPHHLIESFNSTLDELKESDFLLHVVDISHPNYEDQIHTVNRTLKSLDCQDKPSLLVLNKIDLYRKVAFDDYLSKEEIKELEAQLMQKIEHVFETDIIAISAITKENLVNFKSLLKARIQERYKQVYPYKPKGW